MSIDDRIAAAQAKVDADNTALAIDAQALADLQAQKAANQPHLDLLDQVEATLAKAEAGLADDLKAALDTIKSGITPLIKQMRDLLNA